MRRTPLLLAAGLTATSVLLLSPAPAQATVHEIIGQWCSGHDELNPPGITGRSNADNFAQPLAANGVETGVTPFDPPGDQPQGLLITFDYDHPTVKVVGTGIYVQVGATPAGPLYLELIEPDADFPAFRHCPRLTTG